MHESHHRPEEGLDRVGRHRESQGDRVRDEGTDDRHIRGRQGRFVLCELPGDVVTDPRTDGVHRALGRLSHLGAELEGGAGGNDGRILEHLAEPQDALKGVVRHGSRLQYVAAPRIGGRGGGAIGGGTGGLGGG